jgi:hypothetical protein
LWGVNWQFFFQNVCVVFLYFFSSFSSFLPPIGFLGGLFRFKKKSYFQLFHFKRKYFQNKS